METKLKQILEQMEEKERKELYRTFEISEKNIEFIKVKKILLKTFNMAIDRESKHSNRKQYQNILINYNSLKRHLKLYQSSLITDVLN